MDYSELLNKIQEIFLQENTFIMRKVVEEFELEGKFVGDFYTFLIYENLISQAPRMYQIGGPFDLVSNKAPQQALIWQDGKLILNQDFTEYVDIRTGAMDSLLVRLLDRTIDENTKVLLFGTGKTAFWSIKIMKSIFPSLKFVDYINSTSTKDSKFEQKFSDESLVLNVGNINQIENYDYIFCHTNTKQHLLQNDLIPKLKRGSLLTTFISSTENGEVADEFYSNSANVILDWDKNIEKGKDLNRAVKSGLIDKDQIITIKDLLAGKEIDKDKPYTLFRSVGTPMQNLAVLKVLISDK